MDKRVQVGLITAVSLATLGGFYWAGTRNSAAPVPVSGAATTIPTASPTVLATPVTTTTATAVRTVPVASAPIGTLPVSAPFSATTSTTSSSAPRDTVSLLPQPAVLKPQTPTLGRTTTTQMTQASPPQGINQTAYAGPNVPATQPVQGFQPMSPQSTYTARQINQTETVRTVHKVSTQHYEKAHHHKSGNIHVARATKHTVMFAAKLPFRLRP